ncbi:PKD domain-containing protein [Haloarcula sp. S1CR25-12]|uniref:PKD domain-containing protein n=1 Tax=Haloarcula saliterrae TaxID=2950534 RepID=A0ABU2F7X4_9EURY|nr:PKD domain-containing protein [Haloarcula sp. S1CR25-12]MDS0258368.1 PKD domain-containing protein [Haloarcula sp. S1CR25-12]
MSAAETQELDAENDTDAPEWTNATMAGSTEIELTFTDNSTIDRQSVTAGDFALSSGSVSNVTVDPTGDGATVTLLLGERQNVDNVTVSFADGGAIADGAGNRLTSGTMTVTGMDTLVPDFRYFVLTRLNDSTVEVRLATTEPLSGLRLAVTGPAEDRLTMANFTAEDDSNTRFRTRYTVPEYGAYSFVWERAIDRNGNMRVLSRMRQFRYEDSAPDIVLDGPETTTVGTAVNFSAAETVDTDGIESYRWYIDGGTLLTGPSVHVAFATAGRHDITLEVTDSEGHTAVATRQLTVRATADEPSAVTVVRQNATHATATVEGTGLVQQVRARNGSLVEGGNVTLDRLSAAFPANRSLSLGMAASDRPPASFDGPWFGLFSVDHAVPANRVSVRFSVNRTALNRTGVAPEDVVLSRNADGWTPLTTSVVGRTERGVTYQATAPGLSRFAVGAKRGTDSENRTGQTDATATQPTDEGATESDGTAAASDAGGRPDIAITNVSLNATAPTTGDAVRITVTAENRGTADGSYPFSVRLDDSSVATHEIAVPAGETRTRSYVQNLSTAGELVVGGQSVTNVSEAGGGGSLLPGPVAGLLSGLPNPLSLWPSGIVGTILGALVGLLVAVYSVLKALAIYLGY